MTDLHYDTGMHSVVIVVAVLFAAACSGSHRRPGRGDQTTNTELDPEPVDLWGLEASDLRPPSTSEPFDLSLADPSGADLATADLATALASPDLATALASPDLATAGPYCVQSSANQCGCFYATPGGGNVVSSCSGSQWSTSVCCATSDYASGSGSCFCAPYGCDTATASNSGPCNCWLGGGPATSCSPTEGAICCRWNKGPSCDCRAGRASCPADYTAVSSCSASSPQCGAGYTFPKTVSSCK